VCCCVCYSVCFVKNSNFCIHCALLCCTTNQYASHNVSPHYPPTTAVCATPVGWRLIMAIVGKTDIQHTGLANSDNFKRGFLNPFLGSPCSTTVTLLPVHQMFMCSVNVSCFCFLDLSVQSNVIYSPLILFCWCWPFCSIKAV